MTSSRLSAREEWVIRQAKTSPGPVLDIGAARAGEGRPVILERLLEGQARVIGLDLNEDKLRRLGLPGSVAADARRLPFQDGAFGAVLLCEVLEHVFEPVPLLREAGRVLRPGGRLVLTTPNPYQPTLWLRRWLLPSAWLPLR